LSAYVRFSTLRIFYYQNLTHILSYIHLAYENFPHDSVCSHYKFQIDFSVIGIPVSQLITRPYPNKLRLLTLITILGMNFDSLLQKIETLSVPSLE